MKFSLLYTCRPTRRLSFCGYRLSRLLTSPHLALLSFWQFARQVIVPVLESSHPAAPSPPQVFSYRSTKYTNTEPTNYPPFLSTAHQHLVPKLGMYHRKAVFMSSKVGEKHNVIESAYC